MVDLDDPRPLARLPLVNPAYPFMPAAATAPLARDHDCVRCSLGRLAKPACIEGGGPKGATLLVLGSPTEADACAGKWLSTGYNAIVEAAVRKYLKEWRTAWAVSCPAGRDPSPSQVEACRPYLMGEFDYKPPRAILFGPVAAEAATGFPFWADLSRRARCTIRGVPTFLVLHPQKAAHNRHLKNWLDEDVAWALQADPMPQPGGEVRVLLTADEAEAWLRAVQPDRALSFDTEYWPKNKWAKEFVCLCASFCQEVGRPAVIPGALLREDRVRLALKAVMEDARIPKTGHDVKNDRHVLWRWCGVDVVGMEWDTLKVAGLVESEAPKGLGKLSWTVNMGGYKQAGQVGADDEDDE